MTISKLEKVAIANALQLEALKAARRCASHSGLFLANLALHMHTNYYCAASNKKF